MSGRLSFIYGNATSVTYCIVKKLIGTKSFTSKGEKKLPWYYYRRRLGKFCGLILNIKDIKK